MLAVKDESHSVERERLKLEVARLRDDLELLRKETEAQNNEDMINVLRESKAVCEVTQRLDLLLEEKEENIRQLERRLSVQKNASTESTARLEEKLSHTSARLLEREAELERAKVRLEDLHSKLGAITHSDTMAKEPLSASMSEKSNEVKFERDRAKRLAYRVEELKDKNKKLKQQVEKLQDESNYQGKEKLQMYISKISELEKRCTAVAGMVLDAFSHVFDEPRTRQQPVDIGL
jgi:chromosome segregation ATPase